MQDRHTELPDRADSHGPVGGSGATIHIGPNLLWDGLQLLDFGCKPIHIQ